MVADDTVFEGNAAGLRIAESRGCAAIGNRHDDVGIDMGFLGKVHAHVLARRIDVAPAND